MTILNFDLKEYAQFSVFCFLAMLSGCFDGLNQTLLFHYGAFSAVFDLDAQYWNPAISWTNKGSNFFSRTIFVFATDAYHLTRFLYYWLLVISVYFLGKSSLHSNRFLSLLLTFAVVFGLKSLGFHLLYSVLFGNFW